MTVYYSFGYKFSFSHCGTITVLICHMGWKVAAIRFRRMSLSGGKQSGCCPSTSHSLLWKLLCFHTCCFALCLQLNNSKSQLSLYFRLALLQMSSKAEAASSHNYIPLKGGWGWRQDLFVLKIVLPFKNSKILSFISIKGSYLKVKGRCLEMIPLPSQWDLSEFI